MTGGAGPDGERGSIRGTGIGLRSPHYRRLLAERPPVPWLEALVNNYMGDGGQPLAYLERIRADYPLSFHGVGLSLGSADPLDRDYLRRLQDLIERFEPAMVSEHLCWSAAGGHNSHELLPLPYTPAVVEHVATRIREVQDRLGRRILIENVSTYLSFRDSRMSEWEFVTAVLEAADCELLLDVNNVFVSARNQGFAPSDYLAALPRRRVREMHLAGYEDRGSHLLDTHGEAVHPPVWALYEEAVQRFGPVPTLIEWDRDIPDLDVLLDEAQKAAAVQQAGAPGPDAR